MKHTINEEIRGVLIFVGTIWAVFVLDLLLPGSFLTWGLVPRTLWGLVGIPLAPFLHADFGHLLGNTVPLIVLLMLLAGSRTATWETVAAIIWIGGGLLWLLGRNGSDATGQVTHVGASGLIYGLIAFLIVAGFRERRMVPLLVALFVGFLYGTTLITGVLPSFGGSVSWDGHLYGALAGGALAYFTLGKRAPSSEQDD